MSKKTKLRFLPALLLIAAVLLCSGCSFSWESEDQPVLVVTGDGLVDDETDPASLANERAYSLEELAALPQTEQIYSTFNTGEFRKQAIASGVAFLWLPLNGKKKGQESVTGVFAVIPALMFSLWLIAGFRTKATEPEILDYCYEVLATAAMAFAFYCSAGFAFGVKKPGRCVFASLTALYFGIMSLGSDMAVPLKLVMSGAVIVQAAAIFTLLLRPGSSAAETAEE